MRTRRDRGGAAVELTLLTPGLLLLALLVVLAFRVVAAQSGADAAAHAAARAATLERTPEDAQAAAAHAVRTHNMSCASFELELSTDGLEPGSTVNASLTCHADLADLSGLRIAPGTYTATGEASAVVDTYRNGETP